MRREQVVPRLSGFRRGLARDAACRPTGLKQQPQNADTRNEDRRSTLVMIRTFFSRLRHTARRSRPVALPRPRALPAVAPAARGIPPLGSERGDTLIEVIISAVLIALVVVASLTGLDSTNRSVALQRARSQADALAQQDEDQLRGEPVAKLSELSRTREVVANGTKYTIISTSQYVADATATASCSSSTPSADYLQTTSKVTWPSLGVGKPVVETSVISPPPGAALIVQVTESGTPIQGATVQVTGPSPATVETSTNGCAILAVLPGEDQIHVSKSGYVDPNWYADSHDDLSVTRSVYLPAETTAKEGYYLGRAGKLAVSFAGSIPAVGDSFVAHNSGMATFKPVVEAYKATVESLTTVYPFPGTSPYTVYAGECEADRPKALNAGNPEVEVVVPAGGTAPVIVTQPPINVKVMSGKSKTSPGKPVENAIATLTDTGCGTKRETKTNAKGTLERPGAPFGTYSLCVTGGASGLAANRKYTTTFANNTVSGPSELGTMTNAKELSEGAAVIYMESGAPSSPGTLGSGTSCP
jgi:Tfp pilus assembly protein PilV